MPKKKRKAPQKAREPTQAKEHPQKIQNTARKPPGKPERPKRIRPNKNVSKTIRNGTAVYTRDEYFEDSNGYRKPEYINNDKLYRDAVVVDSNRDDEMALIKLQSGGKEQVVNRSGQVESYAPYIKTKDNEGRPIRLGEKFRRGEERFDVSAKDANKMKMEALGYDKKSKEIQARKYPSQKQKDIIQEQKRQRNSLQKLKGRKKKNH